MSQNHTSKDGNWPPFDGANISELELLSLHTCGTVGPPIHGCSDLVDYRQPDGLRIHQSSRQGQPSNVQNNLREAAMPCGPPGPPLSIKVNSLLGEDGSTVRH